MRGLKATLEVMSPEEVQLIHDSSLEILEKMGINVPNQEVLHLCEELGGIVDYDAEILKIPALAMEKVLESGEPGMVPAGKRQQNHYRQHFHPGALYRL